MKQIDKNLRKQEGEMIVSEFLRCFYGRTNTYPNDFYSAFGSEIDDQNGHVRYKKRLIDQVLLPEQNRVCCYCMRRLDECRIVSVEHIMPNHAKDKAELDSYRTKPSVLDGIPHSNDFKQQIPISYPPHPHSIAYQNLVLSCDGDLFKENSSAVCCNLRRKHSFLHPFILYPNIQQSFVYLTDGTAEWKDDPESIDSKKNSIKVLGLNNFVLKTVRRIWFFCNDNGYNPSVINKSELINLMIGELSSQNLSEGEVNMLMNFKKEKYWNLLLQYDAFSSIPHV